MPINPVTEASMTDTIPALRFVPYRKHDVIEMCLADQALAPEQQADFRQLCHMLGSIFHFEFHQVLEALKASYAPLDPDADTRRYPPDDQPDNHATPPQARAELVELLGGLLEKANYERISQADLNQALHEASLFKIRLQVDFDDFAEVLLFCRGESLRTETLKTWFGLGRREITFTNYDRVVVYLRFRDDYQAGKGFMPACKPGATVLKLFQNVPKADLEMLFPNTQVRMRTVDKLMIGVPAAISGGIVVTTKLGASLVLLGSLIGFWIGLESQPVELNQATLVALLAGLGTLGGYLWKQFSNFKNRKLQFMQTLTQNLYFKNLDNNAGVFHRLTDDAEEEENKEAILAYYFLLTHPQGLSQHALDQHIERWFREKWACTLNFEIDDALQKLLALGLVQEGQGTLTAIPLQDAIRKLDQRWDDYFIPEEAS